MTTTQGEHAQTEAHHLAEQAGAAKFYPEHQRASKDTYLVTAGFIERFYNLCMAQVAALIAAPTDNEVLPLLIRDIANDLGKTAIEVMQVLRDTGHGNTSVNTAVTRSMAASLRKHFETAPTQPAAPQGVAYAELPASYQSSTLIAGNDGCTVAFHFGTGCEADVESWLSAVTERASHGQAPAGATDEMEINRPFEDPAPPFNQWRGEMQSALKRAGVYAARSPGAGNKLTLRWRTTREDVLPTPTAQAAPAAGEVAGPTVTREFTNELGNAIRITVEGPNSMHENIVTPMEAEQFRSALNEHAMRAADTTWCEYVAGIICTYLNEDADGQKAKAIAGIIERRLMFLSKSTAPMDRDTLYLLRRLLSNQFTFTSAEFRAELEKIVEGAARAPADSVLEDAARLEFEMQHGSAIDAARKQGGA